MKRKIGLFIIVLLLTGLICLILISPKKGICSRNCPPKECSQQYECGYQCKCYKPNPDYPGMCIDR